MRVAGQAGREYRSWQCQQPYKGVLGLAESACRSSTGAEAHARVFFACMALSGPRTSPRHPPSAVFDLTICIGAWPDDVEAICVQTLLFSARKPGRGSAQLCCIPRLLHAVLLDSGPAAAAPRSLHLLHAAVFCSCLRLARVVQLLPESCELQRACWRALSCPRGA